MELNGSLAANAGLVGLDVKGSGPAAAGGAAAAASFGLAANRSGSGAPVVVPNGSAEAAKGSSEEKGAALVAWKKESAAKGSEPLKGSPPNGSDLTETDTECEHQIHVNGFFRICFTCFCSSPYRGLTYLQHLPSQMDHL